MHDDSIDLKPLTLAESSTIFPRKAGKKTPLLTIKRWIINGYRGIHLTGTKVGNEWFTTAAAIAKFQADCTSMALGTTVTPVPDLRLESAAARARLRRCRGFGKSKANKSKQDSGGRDTNPSPHSSPSS